MSLAFNDYTINNVVSQEELFISNLENQELWNSIPQFSGNVHEHGSLVRFKGMIQDMHSPEYYLEKYEIVNKNTNEKYIKNGKYVDTVICQESEEIDYDCINNKTSERQSYVIISTPALNEWVESHEKQSLEKVTISKRKIEEAMETETNESVENKNKKLCTDNVAGCSSSSNSKSLTSVKKSLPDFPIPGRTGVKLHLKVYNNQDTLKLNDVIEFVGFLSNDKIEENTLTDEVKDNDMEVENVKPSSPVIPRIHCLKFKKIHHDNPLVPPNTTMTTEKMQILHKELTIVLTQLLLGDDLAAEYLICNLISEVYARKDFMVLGKFSLNLSNIPQLNNVDYVQILYDFIANFVPKSHYLPMSLDNINELPFTPKKDYDDNRLRSGLLQLSTNTHLILDETKLSQGNLNSAGVFNIKAIADGIKNQKISYDFNYYPIEYECDIPFIIFSQGKSLLPSDCHVILKPDEICVNTFAEIVQAAKHFLNPQLLNDIRFYLTYARRVEYKISNTLQDLVQQEFVNMRQNENNISADHLHGLLVLARLVCISQGKSELDEECWKKALSLEQKRKERLVVNEH